MEYLQKLQEQENPDVTEPTEEPEPEAMCNLPQHNTMRVVMIISLVLNVVLIGVLVYFVVQKMRNRKDDTPIIDYDIIDDEEE